MNAHNVPALPVKIEKIVAQYDAQRAAIPATIEQMKSAIEAAQSCCCLGGTYAGNPVGYVSIPTEKTLADTLLESSWLHVYALAKIDMLAPASEREAFKKSLELRPEFTAENLAASFGPYLADPRFNILKGLAECFAKLDPVYKSHSKVKIGVKGLPKRIIIRNCGEGIYNSYGQDTLRDALNALRMVTGNPHLTRFEFEDILAWEKIQDREIQAWEPHRTWRSGELVSDSGQLYRAMDHIQASDRLQLGEKDYRGWRKLSHVMPGIRVVLYQNGNAHLIFDRDWLRSINLALAEFYGDVLPENDDEKPENPRPSAAVSKDLAFYWTPEKVTRKILAETRLNRDNYSRASHDRMTSQPAVLEPSCGEGHMMDVIKDLCPGARTTGVEIHGGRLAKALAKGHQVRQGNFLQFQPQRIWDLVVMNPPFANGHWKKHLIHALKFLKNGEDWQDRGELVCILPASAQVDGHLKELGIRYTWRDLPMASFREAGTNVATGFIHCGPR